MTAERIYRNADVATRAHVHSDAAVTVDDRVVHVTRGDAAASTHAHPERAVAAIQVSLSDADGALAGRSTVGSVTWAAYRPPLVDVFDDMYPSNERLLTVLDGGWLRVRTSTADGWLLTDYAPHTWNVIKWHRDTNIIEDSQ